jgi:hypothetical protein
LRMATENPWRARKIQAELSKLEAWPSFQRQRSRNSQSIHESESRCEEF